MNEFADKVMSPRLSTITVRRRDQVQGAQKRAVRIKYDLDALASRGISVEEIRQAVAREARIDPVGSIRTQQQIYIIEVKGAEPTAAFFRPLIVAWRNGPRCGCRTWPRSRTWSRTTRRAPSTTAPARSSCR